MRSSYVFQVATPFSTGTGVYLPGPNLIVTNEHVVRDNATVVVGNDEQGEQLAPVVYLDPYYDLAFLRPETAFDLAPLPLSTAIPEVGTRVFALGQHFGQQLQKSEGHILETDHEHHGIVFLLHDAWQEARHSGGPLFDEAGALVGINMYDIHEQPGRALSLGADRVSQCLTEFAAGNGRPAARCFNCRQLTFEVRLNPTGHCPNCGEPLLLPNMVADFAPDGVAATLESIIATAGHDPRLARRGPHLWSIRQGSAIIQLTYHEESGLVTGDAYLCSLPEDPGADLFAFLLRENDKLRQLTFSTYGQDIVLSLLIYDRYLIPETALPHFEHLFAMADKYDNVLVERFGAGWLG